jgi:hypothetical protein
VPGVIYIYTYMCVSLFVGFGRRLQATVDEKNTENSKTQTTKKSWVLEMDFLVVDV